MRPNDLGSPAVAAALVQFARTLRPGDVVHWDDPDQGVASGPATVQVVLHDDPDEIALDTCVALVTASGGEVRAPVSELRPLELASSWVRQGRYVVDAASGRVLAEAHVSPSRGRPLEVGAALAAAEDLAGALISLREFAVSALQGTAHQRNLAYYDALADLALARAGKAPHLPMHAPQSRAATTSEG
jgi:hypothetical protein